MKTRTWIYASATGIAALALIVWAFMPRAAEVEVATVTQGHFETTVDEDGRTRLRDRYVVSAPLAGVLARIALREGDSVDADAVIATLTPTLSAMLDERTVREQQVRVEIAEAQVMRVDARVESAKVALLQADNEVRRSEQLAGQGFVSATKLETDRLAAQAARSDLDAARQERHVAGHEVEQARAALLAVQSPDKLGRRAFVLHAPAAGQVLRVVQPSEAAVPIGAPLVELGDTRKLEVVAELLTTDALRARPGSRVVIERWGGDGTLEGRVRLVEPGAFTKISALGVEEQRVRVLIDITSPGERWRALGDGFRVSVRIVTMAAEGVLKVPVSCVFPIAQTRDRPSGGMAVFAVVDGRARLVPVEVGARNGAEAWLVKGLPAGASVIVYPPASIRDGLRVKVRSV